MTMKQVTLNDLVGRYLLRYRKITATKAYELYDTMRLASVISELRAKGWPIETTIVEKYNRWNRKIRYGVYWLPDKWSLKDLEK